MKLLIIMPPHYAMPPTRGGSVERLTEILIRCNEAAPKPWEITVLSRRDERTADSAAYAHTRFVYTDTTRSEPPSNRLECAVRKKFGSVTPVRWDYVRAIKKAVGGEAFDEILLENCFELARPLYKIFGKKQMILHAYGRFFGEEHPDAPRAYRCVRRFLFPSEALRREALAVGVPAKRSSLLHDCVDMSLFDRARYADIRDEKRAKYGLESGDILGIFVGRLTPEKGVLELIKAMGQTTYGKTRLKLLIVGASQYGKELRDEYREELEAAAPEGKIVFVGSVRTASAARFFARADFAVVPSLTEKPAGLPVLEAMASGLPLIVSDADTVGEYTAGLRNAMPDACVTVKRGLGYVTSLAKAIDGMAERLHDDPAFAAEAADAARRCAEDYDSQRYLQLFCENIEERNDTI